MALRNMAVLLFTVSAFIVSVAQAQHVEDMWTGEFRNSGLFTPHRDYCDSSTEVFVQIGETTTRGYCIEKDERTAATWLNARQTCAGLGKRLPESSEFQYACINASGLNDMTGNFEWTSNYGSVYYFPNAVGVGNMTFMTGHDSCAHVTGGFANDTGNTYPYRCVR